MPPAPPSPSSYGQRVSLRRRTTALLIAIAINVLILIMLLRLSPGFEGGKSGESRTLTFNVAPDSAQNAAPQAAKAPSRATRSETAPPPRPTPPPPIVQIPTPTGELRNVLIVTRDDFKAADIAKMPSQAAGASGAEASAGSGAGDTDKVGTAPNGEPLYAAEWYREPTQQQLSFYTAKYRPVHGSWAVIACKTVARFHVDDCVPLGDSPAGSHLAGAILEAAWQFLVRPPRVGGKLLVGSWVRIRITFDREAKE